VSIANEADAQAYTFISRIPTQFTVIQLYRQIWSLVISRLSWPIMWLTFSQACTHAVAGMFPRRCVRLHATSIPIRCPGNVDHCANCCNVRVQHYINLWTIHSSPREHHAHLCERLMRRLVYFDRTHAATCDRRRKIIVGLYMNHPCRHLTDCSLSLKANFQ